MGEDKDNCSEFCTIFILTLSRMAGAIVGGLFISFYCFGTLPMAIIAGFYLCDIYLAKNATTKDTIAYLIIMTVLYNTAWIFTWDREQVVAASVLLFLIAQTNIISLGILARNIAYDNHQLREEKPKIYWYENVKLCPKKFPI